MLDAAVPQKARRRNPRGSRPSTISVTVSGRCPSVMPAVATCTSSRRATLHGHAGAVYDFIVANGDSILAEHGIGWPEVDELEHHPSKIEHDVMPSIKRTLDPGI
jgi:FAD/FMN-containing dehydrogenase